MVKTKGKNIKSKKKSSDGLSLDELSTLKGIKDNEFFSVTTPLSKEEYKFNKEHYEGSVILDEDILWKDYLKKNNFLYIGNSKFKEKSPDWKIKDDSNFWMWLSIESKDIKKISPYIEIEKGELKNKIGLFMKKTGLTIDEEYKNNLDKTIKRLQKDNLIFINSNEDWSLSSFILWCPCSWFLEHSILFQGYKEDKKFLFGISFNNINKTTSNHDKTRYNSEILIDKDVIKVLYALIYGKE